MSKGKRRRITFGVFLLVLVGAVTFDLSMTHARRSLVRLSGAQGAETVRPLVALATSQDLSPAVDLDSPSINYDQVKQLVYLALDRDQSTQSIRSIVKPTDWVAIKVNMVSAPLEVNGRKIGGFWDGREDGVPHWGSVSDLRVTKALIAYLIERVGPRRISIVEGSGEIARTGSPYFDSYAIDGWTVTWAAFDSLSYQGIVDGFNAAQTRVPVDIVDLLDDEPVLTPVPGGGLQLLGGQTRGYAYDDFVPGYGTPRGSWYVPRTLLECDKLISLATLKTTAPGITVFMKNYVGAVGIRGYNAGPGKMAVIDGVAIMPGYMDVLRIRPPDYCLGSGFWSSDGWYGGTYDINRNVVIAGQNVVASECVAARLMGFNPRDLQQILLARDLGLGSFEENSYQVVGGDPAVLSYRFPGNANFKPSGFQEYLMLGPFDGQDVTVDQLGGDEAHALGVLGQEAAGKTWWAYSHQPGYPEPYTDMQQYNLGSLRNKIMYAFTYVQSESEQDGYLKFGCDGPARVWVNGELALESSASPYNINANPVHLRQGTNAILVKVRGTARGAGFGLSVVDQVQRGRMLTSIRPGTTVLPTAVTDTDEEQALPATAQLRASYPNPFNATVTVPFVLPRDGAARLSLYDMTGQEVRVLWDQQTPAGAHAVRWDGQDASGRVAATGVYLVRLQSEGQVQTQRITLLK